VHPTTVSTSERAAERIDGFLLARFVHHTHVTAMEPADQATLPAFLGRYGHPMVEARPVPTAASLFRWQTFRFLVSQQLPFERPHRGFFGGFGVVPAADVERAVGHQQAQLLGP
jgi:hypothetical protein